jgi:biotin carboxylase
MRINMRIKGGIILSNKFIVLFGNIHHMKKGIEKGYKFINILLDEPVPQGLIHENIINIVLKEFYQIEDIIAVLVKTHNIKGIVSFVDRNDGVKIANDLSKRYYLVTGSNSNETIKIFNNKEDTRKLLLEKGLKSVSYRKGAVKEDFSDFLSLNKEIVIKPVNGQGSTNVKKISNIRELTDYFKKPNKNNEFIAEEYIKGKEFSVESVTYNRNHYILGITEKMITGEKNTGSAFVERGHQFPARISKLDQERIIEYVKQFLDASNLKNGPSHTEVILSNEGPILVESQLRPGGDLIPKLIELTTGIDIFSKTFDLYNGHFSLPEVAYNGEACIQFFIPPVGIVKSLNIPDSIENDPEVYRLRVNISTGTEIKHITNTFNRSYGDILVFSNESAIEKSIEYYEKIIESINYV